MKEHTYTHTKDRPYLCGVGGCEKRFRQAGKLSLHRRTHEEYVLKQYDCRAEYLKPPLKDSDKQDIPAIELSKVADENKEEEKGELQPKTDEKARLLLRMDSGKTTASAEEIAMIRKSETLKETAEDYACPQGGFRLTKEALEKLNQNTLSEDILIQYLEHINSPMVLSLRPVLPPPKNRTEHCICNPPDLFDLVKKFAQE